MQDAYGLTARRRGAAEDAVQLRRLGLGVLLAAARRGAAGGGGAGRAPRPGAADRDDRSAHGVTTLHFVPSMLQAFMESCAA